MDERTDYITWDQYFMGIARLSAMRSKDPNTQVGACIVDGHHRILSVGYNGMPRGCADRDFPWMRAGDTEEDSKYLYVVHAELNAILNFRGGTLEGSTLYVTLFPCSECAKAIIQAGIRKIIYADEYRASGPSKRMLDAAGVKYERYGGGPVGLIWKCEVLDGIYDSACVGCNRYKDGGCGDCGVRRGMDEAEGMPEAL